MARTANVVAHVGRGVKEEAEQVLDRGGMAMSRAVGSVRRQSVFSG